MKRSISSSQSQSTTNSLKPHTFKGSTTMVTKGKPCNNTIKLNIVLAIPAYGYMTVFTPPVLAIVLTCPSSLSSRSRAKAVPKKLQQ